MRHATGMRPLQQQQHLARQLRLPVLVSACRRRCVQPVAVATPLAPSEGALAHPPANASNRPPSAEERLQQQLRSLPTISVDSLASAAAAAAASSTSQVPKQQPSAWRSLQQLASRLSGQGSSEDSASKGFRSFLPSGFPHIDGRLRGLILLNAMTLLMGSNWVVVKSSADAATMTDATMFMAMRFMLAAAFFIPFLKPDKKIAKAGLEIGVWYALGYVTQALALANTAASRASLLSTFTVLIVPLIAGLSGQHIRPIVWACSAAALAGTAMLEEGSSLGPPNIGDAWAVASAIFFGAQMFVAERNMRKLPKGSELSLMAVSMLTVAIMTAGAAAVAHSGDVAHAAAGLQQLLNDWRAALPAALGGGGAVAAGEAAEAARTLQQLLYTAVVSTDLVLFIELVALQDVTSTDAAMIYSLEPVAGALMAYAFLGERWGAWGWAGGATILAASMLTQLGGATTDDGSGEGGEKGEAPAAAAQALESLDAAAAVAPGTRE